MQYSSPLHGELLDLVQRLSLMAKVYKVRGLDDFSKDTQEYLVTLTHIVIPALPQEKTMDLIQQLLLLPSFFSTQSPQQLEALVAKPPVDDPHALPFRLLLDLREIQSVLKGVIQVQLLRILDNVPSDNTLRQQLEFMSNLQEVFMSWSCKNLSEHSKTLMETPSNLQRQTLLVLAPKIQHSVVKLVIELFHLPVEELELFKVWLDNLPYNRLVLFVNLLVLQEGLLEVHARLTQTPTVGSKRSYIDSLDLSDGFSSLGLEPQAKSQRLGSSTEELRRMVSMPPTDFDFFMPDDSFFGDAFPDLDFTGTDFSLQIEPTPAQSIQRPTPSPRNSLPNTPNNFEDLLMDCETGSLGNSFELPFYDIMGSVPTTLDFPFPSPNQQPLPYPISLVDSASCVPTNLIIPPTQTIPVAPVPLMPMPFSLPFNAPQPTTTIPTAPALTPKPDPVQLNPAQQIDANSTAYKLTVTTQPPGQTVYQRILKPFPAVTLHHSGGASLHNLFVEACLIRSDELKELPKCLEGTRVVPLGPSLFTAFKKLKILATSQQQGTTFRIMFQLKRYEESVFHTIPGVAVLSNPIEVYSHTYYLPNKRRNAAAPPPMVTESIPPVGSSQGGDRILLLGVNFVESDKLVVSFGDVRVKPTFHEANALICTTPPGISGSSVALQVSNDGSNFCQSEELLLQSVKDCQTSI